MRIISQALQTYCTLVTYFGFEESWEAFREWQNKFASLFIEN